ncbi:hypothetical protein VP424E501_P0157 [Vibrio phage 424E50-1]|nr:hypothetical protein VP424E501_P0157 [Vibrio phage 424E50-1]
MPLYRIASFKYLCLQHVTLYTPLFTGNLFLLQPLYHVCEVCHSFITQYNTPIITPKKGRLITPIQELTSRQVINPSTHKYRTPFKRPLSHSNEC